VNYQLYTMYITPQHSDTFREAKCRDARVAQPLFSYHSFLKAVRIRLNPENFSQAFCIFRSAKDLSAALSSTCTDKTAKHGGGANLLYVYAYHQ